MDTENRRVEFYPPKEADEQPWNHLPDSPQDSGQPPPEPEEPAPAPADAGTPRTVPPLAYLTALLAAGFLLMTAVCVLQFRDSQRELDEVRGALENVQAVDRLQMEKAQLQERVDELTAAVEEAEQNRYELLFELEDKEYEAYLSNTERDVFYYLWFIQNFMESGDYAMAANAMVNGGETCYWQHLYGLSKWNQRLQEQYEEYCQRLIELDYLGSTDNMTVQADGTIRSLYLRSEVRPEASRWAKLWIALSSYYIDPDITQAAQYLKEWTDMRRELIEQHRGSFAIDQYELLKETLIDRGYLTESENGELSYTVKFLARPDD